MQFQDQGGGARRGGHTRTQRDRIRGEGEGNRVS